MKKLTNKIISFTLAFMMTISLAPASLHVYGEETPAPETAVEKSPKQGSENEPSTKQEPNKEIPEGTPEGTTPTVENSRTEKTNEDLKDSKDLNTTTEESSQSEENTDVKDERPSEPVAQAKQAASVEEGAATPAPEQPATNVENLARAVTLDVDTLNGKEVIEKTQFWSNEVITGAISLTLSGAQASIDNAKLVITVENNPTISEVSFTDSKQSDHNERKTDKDYYYAISHFNTLSTGNSIGLPFSFKFDGIKSPKNGDTVEVSATLYQEKDNKLIEIKKASKKYKVQVDTYSAFTSVNNQQVENGDYTYKLTAATTDDQRETMEPNTSTNAFWASFYVYTDKTDEEKGDHSYGYSAKPIGEVIVTIPEGMEIMPSYLVDMYEPIDGQAKGQPGKYKYVVKNPWVGGEVTYKGKKRSGYYFSIYLKATNAHFNKNMPIDADIILTGKDGDQQNLHTSFNVKVVPVKFNQTGGCAMELHSDRNYFNKLLIKKLGITEKEKEIYGRWLADPLTYYASKGHLYTGPDDFTNDGRYFTTKVYNWNNGKNPSEAIGNVNVGKLNSLTFEVSNNQYIKNVFIYGYKQYQLDKFPTHDVKKYEAKLNAQLDEIGNTLYGINGDQEVRITENLQRGQLFAIPENQKFSKVVLKFDKPVIIDNGEFLVLASAKLTDEEINKYDGYKGQQHKESYEMNVSAKVQTGDRAMEEPKTNASNFVSTLNPLIYLGSDVFNDKEKQPFKYKENGTRFDLRVGLTKPTGTEVKSVWGPFKELTGLKTITVLPDGIELLKGGLDAIRTQSKVKDVRLVDNYKGTSLQALIIDFKDASPENDAFVWLPLVATKNAGKDNIIDTYMIYDHNDVIQPYDDKVKYIDQLDLDDDKNTDELFLVRHSSVQVENPLELVMKNQTTEPIYGNKVLNPTIDSDDDFNFNVGIENNKMIPIKKLTIIDILPYPGDKHITKAKDATDYASRGSTFATPMKGKLNFKNDEKTKIRDKFNILYLVSNKVDTIDASKVQSLMEDPTATPDGLTWVDENAIDVNSKDNAFAQRRVVGFKLALKDDEEFAVGDSLDVDVPVHMKHFDVAINPEKVNGSYKKEVAVNTSAYLIEGAKNYSEANETKAELSQYPVTGKIYNDLNNNGRYDDEIDEPIENATVKLFDKVPETSDTASSDHKISTLLSMLFTNAHAEGTNNKPKFPFEAKTDKNGDYVFLVPKRGDNYAVVVDPEHELLRNRINFKGKPVKDEFTTTTAMNNIRANGDFNAFILNPKYGKTKADYNAALFPFHTVQLNITWIDVAESDKSNFLFNLMVNAKKHVKHPNATNGPRVSEPSGNNPPPHPVEGDLHNIYNNLVQKSQNATSLTLDDWNYLPTVASEKDANGKDVYNDYVYDVSIGKYDNKVFTVNKNVGNGGKYRTVVDYTIKGTKKPHKQSSSNSPVGEIYVYFHFGYALYQDYSIGIDAGHKLSESQLPIPVRPGYEFEGWYYKFSDLDTEELKPFDITKPIYRSIHLYAKWKKLPLVIPQYEDKKSVPSTADN